MRLIVICLALLVGCTEKEKKSEDKPNAAPKDAVQLSDESLKLIPLEFVSVNAGKLALTLPAAVRVDQPAIVRTAAYPDETFAGKIVLVSPEVDEKTRTTEVRIETESPKLKPGMFADVEIVTDTVDHVLVIPDDAIQRLDEQEIVFVATDSHTF